MSILVMDDKLMKEEDTKKFDTTMSRSFAGNLLYLIETRPNIMFSTSLHSRFMHCYSHIHCSPAKRALRYIPRTIAVESNLKKC